MGAGMCFFAPNVLLLFWLVSVHGFAAWQGFPSLILKNLIMEAPELQPGDFRNSNPCGLVLRMCGQWV